MFKIQMKEAGTWVTLGGVWGGNLVGERMSDYERCFMVRAIPKDRTSNLVCTREFRAVRIETTR